jgi:hypothetical protein
LLCESSLFLFVFQAVQFPLFELLSDHPLTLSGVG